MSKTIKVEIYDQPYTIAGESDESYVRKLADEVDERMREVSRATRVVDSLRVAVLTAINLADENEAVRERCAKLEAAVAEKTAEFHQLLDRALTRAS